MKNYQHGGDIYSREIRLDFSANVNPLGLPQTVKEELVRSVDRFCAYPDPNCSKLIDAIAKKEGVLAHQVLCGNGAVDLIYRAIFTKKPKKALLLAPTFSEYERALSFVNAEVFIHELREEEEFCLNESILNHLNTDLDMFFLCSPNNPSGSVQSSQLLEKIVSRCEQCGIQLFVDECFLGFMGEQESYSAKKYLQKGVLVLKAFTKLYAMAGLRLGYLLCGEEQIAKKMREIEPPWSISTPAQIAGVAALSETEYVKNSIELIKKERKYLTEELKQIGFHVFPSTVNFLLFFTELPIEELLLKEQIAIRNCENYRGLRKGYYRIAVRLHSENQELIRAIKKGKEEWETWQRRS